MDKSDERSLTPTKPQNLSTAAATLAERGLRDLQKIQEKPSVHSLNERAAQLMKKTDWGYSPYQGLAVAQLLRWGTERIRAREYTEDELGYLLLVLERNPARLMWLLTETDSGDELYIELSDDPEEAAAELWTELLASLDAEPS